MKQRQSRVFPKPPTLFSSEELLRCTRHVARYMLNNYEIPIIFLSEFDNVVNEAYSLNFSDNNELQEVPVEKDTSLVGIVAGDYGNKPVAIIIEIVDLRNVLCIVGSRNDQFYVIDLFHEICYTTKTPEYDVDAYMEEYGGGEHRVYIYLIEEKIEMPIATAAAVLPPPVKKVKRKLKA